ncbi:MAG: ABC transporter substrate-binding protein [Alphaproteobacteria bacterium]|nr:ABC transporter substrate-binding protein [Alphaproteobacteria bacterium]
MRNIKELERLLKQGKLNRRDFMAGATAMGVSAAAASTLLSSTALAAPKKGGKIRIGLGHGSTTDSLDPATFENLYSQVMGSALRNNLMEVDNEGKLVGELAERYDVSDDARVWTFHLRKGVEFHGGKSLDADDVVASINHHRGKDSKSAAKTLLEPITEMKADGKDKVTMTLAAGNADWPFIMSDYHVAIMPAKDGEVDWKSGVGTGAFSLVSYEPGVRTALKRNPNFFKSGQGHFDEAEMITIADVAARTNALTTGEIDAMDRVDLKTAHLLKRRKGINLVETSGTQHYTFCMRCDTPPFDNNDVRLALKYAIDREAILKTVLKGHGVLGNDHPIGRSNRYHADALPQRAYDPDKAKFHLKKAGQEGLKVDLSAADAAFAGAVDAAVLYKEHAAKAGININVVREPNDGYWSNVWMKKPYTAVYWGGRPTEDWMFSTAYAADAAWNDSFWKHDRFNELLLKARSELDEKTRGQLYVEMQTIVANEGGVLVPMFANYVMGLADKVKHNKMAANWSMDGFKCLERWWFA